MIRARSLVTAFRILLLSAAALAAVAGLLLARARDRGAVRPGVAYVCPMHPDVTSSTRGECPICRMELEASEGAAGALAASVGPSTFQIYDYVRKRGLGQDLIAPAWVEGDGTVIANLYNDEIADLTPDELHVFTSSATPSSSAQVHATTDPPEPWDRSTSRVRFRTSAGEPSLRAGDVGWVRLAIKHVQPEVIAGTAILEGDDGPYVLASSPDGRSLAKRPVRIGRVLGGLAVITSGLHAQDHVLVRSAFFLDAERRLRRQASVELSP